MSINCKYCYGENEYSHANFCSNCGKSLEINFCSNNKCENHSKRLDIDHCYCYLCGHKSTRYECGLNQPLKHLF